MILQPTAGLIMEPESHKYFLNGKHLPSVTQIMSKAGLIDFSFVQKDVLEEACARGTVVHKICELWDKGTLDVESLDTVGRAYLTQWIEISKVFLKGRKWSAIELSLAIPGQFAGTLDRAIFDGKTISVLDIKTGLTNSVAEVQLTAYLELLMYALNIKIGSRIKSELITIQLTETKGSLSKTLKPLHHVWASARTIYNYKNAA
jgi:hypothetical protein